MNEHGQPYIDPAFVRGMTQRRLSRRDLFRYAGAGAGALGLSSLAAACGVKGTAKAQLPQSSVDTFWKQQKQAGMLNIAQWPLYIDVNPHNKNDHPSIDLFEKQTGIKVKYNEVIQDDPSFFGTIRPVLQAGQDTGYDIMVITNGIYLTKLIENSWLIPLDQSRLPNFHQYAAPKYQNPSYDPGNKYTVPWQSGFTGIAYNHKLTDPVLGRPVNTFQDLLNPAFKGKVGMFGDNLDLPNFALIGVGIPPETSTPADWQKAADVLKKQRDDGIVRAYYDQSYAGKVSNGDVWLSMAWSGDVYQVQLDAPNLRFTNPKEGALFWTDNQCIPMHAQHPVDAMVYMDFVYQPNIAAMIADYVNYVTPVPAAQDVIRNQIKDPTVADSPLVFPSEQDYAAVHRYRVLTPDEETQWNSIFEPIYQS